MATVAIACPAAGDEPKKSRRSDISRDPVWRAHLKEERKAEKQYRESQQGKFESSYQSLDALTDSEDGDYRTHEVSDGGKGAFLARHPEYRRLGMEHCNRCINRARMTIRRNDPRLLKVFYLVLKNGTDWEKSVCEIMSDEQKKTGLKSPKNASRQTRNGTPPTFDTLDT